MKCQLYLTENCMTSPHTANRGCLGTSTGTEQSFPADGGSEGGVRDLPCLRVEPSALPRFAVTWVQILARCIQVGLLRTGPLLQACQTQEEVGRHTPQYIALLTSGTAAINCHPRGQLKVPTFQTYRISCTPACVLNSDYVLKHRLLANATWCTCTHLPAPQGIEASPRMHPFSLVPSLLPPCPPCQ